MARLQKKRQLNPLILCLVILLMSEACLARAGGGGHGGGGGIFGILMLPFYIPFLIYAWYVNSKINQRTMEIHRLLEQMAKEDPKWSEEKVLETAESIFRQIQNAWSDQDFGRLKKLLHSELYPSWESDLKNQIQRHERNEMSAVSINRMRIVEIQKTADKEKAVFTICFDAQANDKIYINDKLDSVDTKPFREFWSFHWHAGHWQLFSVTQFRGWRRFLHSHLVFENNAKNAPKAS